MVLKMKYTEQILLYSSIILLRPMEEYLKLLSRVCRGGASRPTPSSGSSEFSAFGLTFRHDLGTGFPLVTTREIKTDVLFRELEWMLSGSTSARPLQAERITIYDDWADPTGELGPLTGHQWRACGEIPGVPGIDQLQNLINQIRETPNARDLIVSAWNVQDLPQMSLPPHALMFQCYVQDGKLSLQMYQRSADIFLGMPCTIATYALLTHLIALETELKPGNLIIQTGDLHLYENHYESALLQLDRAPFRLPTLSIRDFPGIFKWKALDGNTTIEDYNPHPAIKALL